MSHTHVVIHETLACQEARSGSITGRQTNVDRNKDFPIAYDVLYDKEEQTDLKYLPRCEVVNCQFPTNKRKGNQEYLLVQGRDISVDL